MEFKTKGCHFSKQSEEKSLCLEKVKTKLTTKGISLPINRNRNDTIRGYFVLLRGKFASLNKMETINDTNHYF